MRGRTAFWLIAPVLVVAACDMAGGNSTTSTPVESSLECPTEGSELETAMLYIEHNATDQDTGVHGNFGGEGWERLCIWNPDSQLILDIQPDGPLGDLGLSDFFFESREPPNDEFSIEDLLTDFPEGEYLVGGIGFDGADMVAEATFTHEIPAEPVITSPELAEDEEQADETISPAAGLTVAWEPVAESLNGGTVEITGYQVIITKVDHEDSNGFSRPVFDVHLGPEATSLTVANQFLESGTLYELEVLAIEASGNQTIALGFFTTS